MLLTLPKDLKRQLSEPPVLAILVERKEAGKEHPVQRPVYYVSEVLIESKQRYPHCQKLMYGVFM